MCLRCCRWWTMIFLKLTQDLDPRLRPVGRSKLLRSLIPTKKLLVEKPVVKRPAEVKAVVIIYDLWMSRKTEEFLIDGALLHRSGEKKTNTGMPSTTATDGVSLYLSIMEVVNSSGLEAKIVGITSDGGGNIQFFREALESKYTNDSVFL